MTNALDKLFVNRKKEKKKKDLFNMAMVEKWSYKKFKRETLKRKKKA